jgi:hypothetical protein
MNGSDSAPSINQPISTRNNQEAVEEMKERREWSVLSTACI